MRRDERLVPLPDDIGPQRPPTARQTDEPDAVIVSGTVPPGLTRAHPPSGNGPDRLKVNAAIRSHIATGLAYIGQCPLRRDLSEVYAARGQFRQVRQGGVLFAYMNMRGHGRVVRGMRVDLPAQEAVFGATLPSMSTKLRTRSVPGAPAARRSGRPSSARPGGNAGCLRAPVRLVRS